MGWGYQYSKEEIKIVSADWASVLPSMKKIRPLRFHNRLGPIVVGVYVTMGGAKISYIPECSVHNLCQEFPVFGKATLQVGGSVIRPEKHKEMFASEAEKLKERTYIPLEGDVKFGEIVAGYERYFLAPRKSTLTSYEEFALLCGWAKKPDLVERALKIVYDELKTWSTGYFSDEGGFENWFKQLEERAWDGDKLNEIYESELVKHKLEKIPVRNILL